MEKKEVSSFFRATEEVSVSCLGWSPNILKHLFEKCRQRYLEHLQGKPLIFDVRNGKWEQSKT